MALIVDCEHATDAQIREMESSFGKTEEAALKSFKKLEAESDTKLVAPFEHWDDIFASMQIQNEQLLVSFPGDKGLMPTQGGISARHYVWVWEAADMLQPMLRAGHFKSVRKAIEFIFKLQDGGVQPEGKIMSHAGAIGTTGPRWLNSTGSALSIAANYYLLSKDKEFLKEYQPKIIKAAEWIVGEIRHQRRFNPDGSRPLDYGLMPSGVADDGDVGQFPNTTDAFLSKGLSDAAALLDSVGDKRKDEFLREAASYRADILENTKRLQHKDGSIERFLPGATRVWLDFDQICNASNFIECEVFPPDSELFRNFARYFEENLTSYPFMSITSNPDKAYLSASERIWYKIYLRRGEWKKAFALLRSNLLYGMAPDTWLVAERYSKSERGYLPFQPNGSGNGRMMDMLLNALYFQYDGGEGTRVAVLCGALPPFYLKQNGRVSLENLHTPDGIISLHAEWLGEGKARISVSGALPDRIQIPDFYKVGNAKGAEELGGGFFKVTGKTTVFDVTVAEENLPVGL